jgi:peptidoglycan/LPS O-acetylase OafA/YrhL
MQPVVGLPVPKKGEQIVGLAAIRILAALLVMSFHLGFWIWAGGPAHRGLGGVPLSYAWLAPFTAPGWIGVEVFFVVSGFVIMYSAQDAMPFGFFRSRFLRLVPTAWICATITALVLLMSGTGYSSVAWLLRLWGKSLLFDPYPNWIDGAYWTLGIEVGFYAIVLAAIALRGGRHIFAVTCLLGLVSGVFWIGSFLTGDRVASIAGVRTWNIVPLRHGVFFALGAFLCLAKLRRLRSLDIVCLVIFAAGGILEIRYSSGLHDAESGFRVGAFIPVAIWLAFLLAIIASVRWSVGYVIIDGARSHIGDLAAMAVAMGRLHRAGVCGVALCRAERSARIQAAAGWYSCAGDERASSTGRRAREGRGAPNLEQDRFKRNRLAPRPRPLSTRSGHRICRTRCNSVMAALDPIGAKTRVQHKNSVMAALDRATRVAPRSQAATGKIRHPMPSRRGQRKRNHVGARIRSAHDGVFQQMR